MIKRVSLIGHTTSAADSFLGVVREITIDITKNTLRVHNGVLAGGFELARADFSNAVAATVSNDGKMTASLVGDIATALGSSIANNALILGHIGTGGAEHPNATISVAGFMSVADKNKLNAIENDATADQTAAEILTAVKTVDGAGSGLDADLLDGLETASAQTVSTVVVRDAAGRAKFVDPSADQDAATKKYVDTATGAISPFFTGDYKFAHKRVDHGLWLLCDGRAVSRTTEATLFAEISTTYGVGDGSTTFNLPDRRGRGLVAENNASLPNGVDGARTTRTRGDRFGDEDAVVVDHGHANGSLSTGNNSATDVTITPKDDESLTGGLAAGGGANGAPIIVATVPAHNHPITGAIANAGVSGVEKNMSPSLVAGNMFIYKG